MLIRTTLAVLFIVSGLSASYAQRLKKADKAIVAHLQQHIRYLADDKLEGRRAGTPGARLAAHYISNTFREIGLQPKGDSGWYQPFLIDDGRQVESNSFLIVNGNDLKLNNDYFPLAYSANGSTQAAVSMALAERGVPWFADLKEMLEESRNNPHFDLETSIVEKANAISGKGATALILYNSSGIDDELAFKPKDKRKPAEIPIVYISKSAKNRYFNDRSAVIDMQLKVEIGEKTREGQNVVGFLDNGAPSTIVLGAHFDHLGYGEDGNSMLRTGEHLIHNGADDNASGTAALMELARLMKNSKDKHFNYLFIAFSAEELGLNGSKYFADHPTIDLKNVNYMINMDMVGRLNDSSKTVTIGGYGTSPEWSVLFADMKRNKHLEFKFDSSGTGPSDHTSFYRKDIPVLFFFTGLHHDYHRPTDDYDKINYTGELYIVRFIEQLIKESDDAGKLAFTKTREAATSSSSTRLTGVTMGIMPDYTFNGDGIRVDGVSEGRPAQKAGLQTGDIIVQLGDFPTHSMQTYMQALNKFKKGEKTKVKYKRGNNVMEADVEF